MKAVKIAVTILVIVVFAIIIKIKQPEIKKWIDNLLGDIEDDVQRNIEKYAEEQESRSKDDFDDSEFKKKRTRMCQSSSAYGQVDGMNPGEDYREPYEPDEADDGF